MSTLALALSTPALALAADDFADRCQAMEKYGPDDLKITEASVVAFRPAKPGATDVNRHPMPRHCLVRGAFEHRIGVDGVAYAIRLELRLPEGWNGRLVFQGGGGMNGYVGTAYAGNFNGNSIHPTALGRGFAVVSTDTGHVAQHGADASFARDQLAKLNYAYAAIGKVAVHAKGIVAALGGRGPERSYFAGCSNGGREAMLMAQRYPTLFDGVLAANPAFNLRDAAVLSYMTGKTYDQAARQDPASGGAGARLISNAEGALVRKALLDQCDALDGARDGMIFDHANCKFDIKQLACKPGQRADSCLAPFKAEAIARAFTGPLDRTGAPRFTSWTWDASVFNPEWLVWQTGIAQADGSVMTGLRDLVTSSLTQYFAFPAIATDALTGSEADVERLLAATEQTAAMTVATSTDFSTFAARGGKMMITDGWSDPIFSANDLVRWFGQLESDMGKASGQPADAFARLFMVPGMAHCSGGNGLDDMDALGALVKWVEQGQAPESITATGAAFPGVSRPMCAWPKIARYKGTGALSEASSFECRR